jgi:tetratricopeptide (TPR) repeat protein
MSRSFKNTSAKTALLLATFILGGAILGACSSREQRAQAYYEQGMSYLAKKDYVKAGIEFKNALQIKKDMVEAFRGLAEIDDHNRNFQGLAGDLRSIVELDPKDNDSRVKLTKLYLLGGALDPALKLSNAAVDSDPQNAAILALKAAVLLRLKDVDGAIQTAQKGINIDPGSTDANSVLAAAMATQGDPNGALKTLANITPAHKEDVGVLGLEINIYNQMGNFQQVETLLRRLIELNPTNSLFRTQLVKFYVSQKREDDAVKELRTVTTANPADLGAELQLIGLLASVKGIDAAHAELVARIGAGGSIFPYQIALARLDFLQGNVADSTSALEKLIRSSSSSDDVMIARTTLAELYMIKNNVAAAEPVISDILGADSHNTTGLRLRAAIRVDRGQFDDAIVDLRAALNDQPQSPQLLAGLGLAYERSGSIELADKAYFDATKASNFAPGLGLNYVTFLRRRGLSEQAERVLVDLASRNPNNVQILSTLAEVKLVRQDWTGAHEVAESIRKLGDKGAAADLINGAAFGGENKINDSLAAFQNAYDANPNAGQPMAALINEYLRSQQIDKAVSFLQAALKANPANAEALVLTGVVRLAKKEPDEARKSFEEAIKQQPKYATGYVALASFYTSRKENDEALNVIRAGLEQQPKSFDLHLALGGVFEMKGEYEAAITEYESLLKDQSGSMIVANNLASLLADHRSDKASLERANSLAMLLKKSEVPQFKDTIGWIAYQRGDYSTARSFLEDAVAKLPNYPLIHYHLGMTYTASGQNAKALEQLKSARDLGPTDAELKTKIDSALKNHTDKDKG